jgi:hypothetical protein
MSYLHETCEGPIEGLFLLPSTWEVLHRENIETMTQLRAMAGWIEQIPGIRLEAAQLIRGELARMKSLEQHFPGDSWPHSSWSA